MQCYAHAKGYLAVAFAHSAGLYGTRKSCRKYVIRAEGRLRLDALRAYGS